MFCSNCGKEAPGKFCSNCGAPLDQNAVQSTTRAVVQPAVQIVDRPDEKKGFWERRKENAMIQAEKARQEREEEKARLAQMDREGIAYCPRCHSTSLSSHKKGFGFGKAAVGVLLTGGIGLVAGGLGSGKVKVTCLKCGHQFMAGGR